MTVAQVEKVADGRLWSGQDALKHGLVDKFGGYFDAIATAKELANLPKVTCNAKHQGSWGMHELLVTKHVDTLADMLLVHSMRTFCNNKTSSHLLQVCV